MQLTAPSLDAAKFAADETSRGPVAGLNIMADRVVATDSYHLLEVKHIAQETGNVPSVISNDGHTGIILAEAALHASRNIPKGETLFALKKAFSSVNAIGTKMTLTTTDLMQEKSVEATLFEGKYPPYETVFPGGQPVAQIMVDAKFLKNMAEYFAKHGDARQVLIQFFGEDKPLVFKGHTAVTLQDLRGLIMPLRIPGEHKGTEVVMTKETLAEIERGLQTDYQQDVSVTLNGEPVSDMAA